MRTRNEPRTYTMQICGDRNEPGACIERDVLALICLAAAKKIRCYAISKMVMGTVTSGFFADLIDAFSISDAKNMTREDSGSWTCYVTVTVTDDRIRECDVCDILVRAGEIGLPSFGQFKLIRSRRLDRLPRVKQAAVLSTRLEAGTDVQFGDLQSYNTARFRPRLDFDGMMEQQAVTGRIDPDMKLLPSPHQTVDPEDALAPIGRPPCPA